MLLGPDRVDVRKDRAKSRKVEQSLDDAQRSELTDMIGVDEIRLIIVDRKRSFVPI